MAKLRFLVFKGKANTVFSKVSLKLLFKTSLAVSILKLFTKFLFQPA